MKKIFLSIISIVFSFSGSLLLMIVLAALSLAYGNIVIKLYTQEVNGMLWQAGSSQFRLQLENIPGSPPPGEDRETQRMLLTVYDAKDIALFNKQLTINWDMFGAGFVKAMQVDTDPELEIVFYSPTKGNAFAEYKQKYTFEDDTAPPISFSFYLDINTKTGKLEIKDFATEASVAAHELAKTILSTIKPLFLFMSLIVGAPIIAVILGLLGKITR